MTYKLITRNGREVIEIDQIVDYAGRFYTVYDMEIPTCGSPSGAIKIKNAQLDEVLEVEPLSIGCRFIWTV